MAQRNIFVSDFSGDEIQDGQAAKVVLKFDDREVYLDATVNEAENILNAAAGEGVETKRRGRRPGVKNGESKKAGKKGLAEALSA